MAGRLEGKVAIITGAARGMGEGHVRAFVGEGARVIALDTRADLGAALADELGDQCHFLSCDVTVRSDWELAVQTAVDLFGKLDILVNNAGILLLHGLIDALDDDYQRVINVNQRGVFLGMQVCAPAMKDAGGGSIVNIGSTAGMNGSPDCFSYVASKWAVRGMTKAAAIELAGDNVRVNAVHPGDVKTEMVAGANEALADSAIALTPLGRYGEVREISSMVVFLASDDATFITGADFAVDGGHSAQ